MPLALGCYPVSEARLPQRRDNSAALAGSQAWVYLTKLNPECRAPWSLQRLRFWGCSSETSSAYPHYLLYPLSDGTGGDGLHCWLPALITAPKKKSFFCFHKKKKKGISAWPRKGSYTTNSCQVIFAVCIYVFMYYHSHLNYSSMADTNC